MFWSMPPSCGNRSPLQTLTRGPFFVWTVLRVRHRLHDNCRTTSRFARIAQNNAVLSEFVRKNWRARVHPAERFGYFGPLFFGEIASCAHRMYSVGEDRCQARRVQSVNVPTTHVGATIPKFILVFFSAAYHNNHNYYDGMTHSA